MKTITIYTKDDCSMCEQTKKLLDKWHLVYTEHNAEHEEWARKYLQELDILQMPVVEVGGQRWSGFRYDKLQTLKANPDLERNTP